MALLLAMLLLPLPLGGAAALRGGGSASRRADGRGIKEEIEGAGGMPYGSTAAGSGVMPIAAARPRPRPRPMPLALDPICM